MKKFLTVFFVAVLTIFFPSCGKTNISDKASQANVICTTYPVWLLTRSLGVDADLLIPAGTGCPHDYALSTQEMMKLSAKKNALLLCNGCGLDNVICTSAARVNPTLKIVPTVIPMNGSADETDPHAFTSPDRTGQMLNVIAGELVKHNPADEAKIKQNLQACEKRLEKMVAKCSTVKKDCSVILMHDTFAPLMNAMHLKVAGVVFEEHISALTVAQTMEFKRLAKEKNVRLLISEPQIPSAVAETLREATGVKMIVLDSLAAGPETGLTDDFFYQNMEKNIAAILDALK